MARSDQQIPFDEGSFLDCKDVDLWNMLARDIYHGQAVKRLESMKRARKQAEFAAKIDYAAQDGWCEEDFLEVTLESFYEWAAKEGRECWDDDGFRRDFAKENPFARRRVVTGRTVITAGTPWKAGARILMN
jgi:hypothetical protein